MSEVFKRRGGNPQLDPRYIRGAEAASKSWHRFGERARFDSESQRTRTEALLQMGGSEADYLRQNGEKYKGLDERYKDPSSQVEEVQQMIRDKYSDVEKTVQIPELGDIKFNAESAKQVKETAQKYVEALFNSDKFSKNKEKFALVSKQTERYLDLVLQAQKEGDVGEDVKAQDVLTQTVQNIQALAFQDNTAASNTLGDHGVRHLVGHNITVAEKIFDQIGQHGVGVKAIDRLMVHQVMIDHDIGYAMPTVNDEVKKGNFSADRGHNLLAAQYIRQRSEDEKSPLSKLFSPSQLSMIHKGALYHDSSYVNFVPGVESTAARMDNFLSAIHVADNTHAFADKLPEVIYGFPATLRTMALLKIAGQSGDDELVQILKDELIKEIDKSDLAHDDKESLKMAAKGISPESYKFTVGRICGNKPDFAIDDKGGLTISVAESAIHRQVVGLFSQGSYKQLEKFIKDISSQSGASIVQDEINRIDVKRGGSDISFVIETTTSPEGVDDFEKKVREIFGIDGLLDLMNDDKVDEKAIDVIKAKLHSQVHDRLLNEYKDNGSDMNDPGTQARFAKEVKIAIDDAIKVNPLIVLRKSMRAQRLRDHLRL